MDVRAFPVGNVLLFFCRTAGLLCLPCGKCFLVLLIVEAFQNRRIETSGQPLDDFIRVARVVYSFFLFVQRHLLFRSTRSVNTGSWNPKCGKAGLIFWEPEKLQAGMQKYPPDPPYPPGCVWNRPSGRMIGRQSKKQNLLKITLLHQKLRCFFAGGRVGRKIFTSRSFFMSGRNPGASACPDFNLWELKARQIVHPLIPS